LLARINILLALDRLHRNPKETIELQTYLLNTFIDAESFESLKKKFGRESIVERQPFPRGIERIFAGDDARGL
jgi:hypothetical protein